MLRNTFIHIPGIGKKTEESLWREGIRTWEDLLDYEQDDQLTFLGRDLGTKTDRYIYIERSMKALDGKDIDFFVKLLPKRELWRVYPEFRDSCVFLDIETTGLSKVYDDITLIGLFDGKDYRTFIHGKDLEKFLEEIGKYSLVVTFNGSLFDLPFIQSKLPSVKLPPAHIDLRFLLRRIGYKGGLKNIESETGISRREETRDIRGFDATVLWSQYSRGIQEALELLIKYNIDDTVNLQKLLNLAYRKLVKQVFPYSINELTEIGDPPEIDAKVTGKGEVIVQQKSITIPVPPKKRTLILLSDILKMLNPNGSKNYKYPTVVGIDLTGSEKRATGWAALTGSKVTTDTFVTDREIIDATIQVKPDLISIDSPLSLPKGRISPYDDSPCRIHGITRECERYLKRIGISVFWCLLPSMQNLTMRGIHLAEKFREKGLQVIESFPGAAQDILKIPRKKTSLDELKEGLRYFGIQGVFEKERITHDELDAITCALVGYFYLTGNYDAIGNQEEDYLILPSLKPVKGARS